MQTKKHEFKSFAELPAILQASYIIALTGLSRAKVHKDLFNQSGFPVITCERRKLVIKQRFIKMLKVKPGAGNRAKRKAGEDRCA